MRRHSVERTTARRTHGALCARSNGGGDGDADPSLRLELSQRGPRRVPQVSCCSSEVGCGSPRLSRWHDANSVPSKVSAVRKREPILIDLALQGGGSHGAFTWGVLDRLLEEPWLRIDGISGTS